MDSNIPHRDINELHKNIGWYIALAVGMMVLGIFAIVAPFAATFALERLAGVAFAVGGIILVVHAFRWRISRKIPLLIHSRSTLLRIRHTSSRISTYGNVDAHNSAWCVLLRGGTAQDNKRISHPSVFTMGMGALQRAAVALPGLSHHGRNASDGIMDCGPDSRNRPLVQRPGNANDVAGHAESFWQ